MGPTGKRWFTEIAMVGVLLAAVQACAPPLVPGRPSGTAGIPLVTKDHQRDAEGGGTVTVDVTVFAGPVPDENMAGTEFVLAEFINRGEGGKKEKRYGWKPHGTDKIKYQLVLSADPDKGKTKWKMVEVNGLTANRVSQQSGHLWDCDREDHAPTGREVDFKVCELPVEYGLSEMGGTFRTGFVRFASDLTGEDAELLSDTPVWISCNSGCCSLGRAAQ